MEMRPLLLKEARALLQEGILTGSVSSAKDRLGKTLRLLQAARFVLWRRVSVSGSDATLGFVSESAPDKPSEAVLERPVALFELMPDRRHGKAFRFDGFTSPLLSMEKAELSLAADYLRARFLESGAWRVTCLLPQKSEGQDALLMELLKRLSFKLEALLHDYAEENGLPQPVAVWTWSLRDPAQGQYFFLPFGSGYLVGFGDEAGVSALHFQGIGSDCASEQMKLWASSYNGVDQASRFRRMDGKLLRKQESILKGAPLEAYRQLGDYLSGRRRELDFPTHESQGSTFQKAVWAELRRIPYGQTRSYLDLAMNLCNQDVERARKLCRAVGAACGANPLCVIVPCHRVLGSDLSLVGFNGGVHFKADLLNLELLGVKPKGQAEGTVLE